MAKQRIYQFDLNGQTKTLDFGMYCWELFGEMMHVGPDQIMTVFHGETTFRAMRTVVYCGIVANDYLHDAPPSVTEADIVKWLNDSPEVLGSIFTTAMQVFFDIDAKAEKTEKAQKKSPLRSRKSKK